jgi:hypothetical protein
VSKTALRASRVSESGLRKIEQIVAQQDRARRHEASAARRGVRLDGWAQLSRAMSRARETAAVKGGPCE